MNIIKSVARKYKKGKSYQWTIPLKNDNPFQDKENVNVITPENMQALTDKIKNLEEKTEQLQKSNQILNIEMTETLKKLTVASQIINKQKDITNLQDTLLAIYMNRGTFSRLRNNKPKELNQLLYTKKKLIDLEDSTPLLLELTRSKKKE